MTKKRTQIEVLEEISDKLSLVINQLNDILNYTPNVVEFNEEDEDSVNVDNNRGDYSSLFGIINEDDSDA
tara:strand:- start:45 stop:254 length:210 start_codon:yes stop_codon:yes gene_type:complete